MTAIDNESQLSSTVVRDAVLTFRYVACHNCVSETDYHKQYVKYQYLCEIPGI